MQENPIYDLTPFTALDFPDHLAAIFWFAGCSMRCSYCYNPNIVLGEGKISEERALEFLQSRVGLLEGVVLSGGEATGYSNLISFCMKIKNLGFKIKLDTNGANPYILMELVNASLVDYVALDYKAPKQKFQAITKNKHFDHFVSSLNILAQGSVDFEVRTTVCNDLLTVDDINRIINDLYNRGYRNTYYLQKYIEDTPHLGKMSKQKAIFEKSRLSDKLDIIWR